jgi:hypothetical protein
VAFNVSDSVREVTVPGDGSYRRVYPTPGAPAVVDSTLKARLPARSSVVWIRE